MNTSYNPEKRVNESQSLNDMAGRGDGFKLLAVIGIGFAPEKDEDPLTGPDQAWFDEYRNAHKPFDYIADEINRA